MEGFRVLLQQEFLRRSARNEAYSLRAFAGQLGTNHATLSSILAGKRKITPATVKKLARPLGLAPAEVSHYLTPAATAAPLPFHLLEQDTFASLAEWYFDAILELALLPRFRLEPARVAAALGISVLQAKLALESLTRLGLLEFQTVGRAKPKYVNSTNVLDPDFTNAARIKYQKALLEKSIAALERVPRARRDHTSTTMAIHVDDLPAAKKLIQDFSFKLNEFLQRAGRTPNEVYQLQVSLFPLSDLNGENK